MPRKFNLNLDTRADLDTVSPVAGVAPGVLVDAQDLAPDYWGPRKGNASFTRSWETATGTSSLYDEITLAGTGTYARARSFEEQFRDLGTKFTLDLWFRLSETAYSGAENIIGLYRWSAGSGEIAVWIRGAGHASVGKMAASIITTPTRSSADSTVTLSGATAIPLGTDQDDKVHVRLVRDGATATLYLNGVSDATSSSLVAGSQIFSTVGSAANVSLGSSVLSPTTEATFKGIIYGAVLRDGAFTSEPIEAVMPCAPWARNVHHHYLGRPVSFGGAVHYFDAGRFAAHAAMTDVGYSTSSAYDLAVPAPAPVQGMRTWTTRTNRTATSVAVGGGVYTGIIS